MSTVSFQEMSEAEVLAASPKEKPKDKTLGKVVYSVQDSDRDYDEKELEAEEKAEKFPKGKFKRIPPIYGTLGYLFRNLSGGEKRNDTVVECFRAAQYTNKSKFIKILLTIWDNLDEHSRHRVDIFDWFIRKYDIPISKFWGVYQEGAFSYEDAIVKSALSASKQHLISVVQKHMVKEKNHNDRKLMADMTGMIENKPLVSIEDHSQTANIYVESKNKLPSFMETLRRSENKLPETRENKLLSEGETEFVDAEILLEDKEEPILVERK